MNARRLRGAATAALTLFLVCVCADVTRGYSVLTHEAIIDITWEKDITPLLLARFPAATTEALREAHAHAYGGAIIQDMGYYPFGSALFSDLTHYVRSGDFVAALLREAEDLDEYAFALGALCHYSADNDGHPIATNPSVPLLYPKLRQRFGDAVTYDDNPAAHIQTEFGFDVLQIAQGHYASGAYHDFIGFKVSKHLLERAFKDTYGIKLSHIFASLDLALGSYRYSVSTLLPTMTRVAWQTHKKDIEQRTPGVTPDQFLYSRSPVEYDKEWGTEYKKPGRLSKTLAFLFHLVPKIGPLRGFSIKPSTPETEALFLRSFDATVVAYRRTLLAVRAGDLHLRNTDLDTGLPALAGEYRRADHAYGQILHKLADDKFEDVTPDLRENILAFYGDTSTHVAAKSDRRDWARTLDELRGLRSAAGLPRTTSGR